MQPLLGPATSVVTMQNGVDAPDILGELIGRARILPGLVKLFTRVVAAGCIEHIGGPGSITFGEWNGARSDRVKCLEEALAQAKIPVAVTNDIRAALWAKLLFVASMGAVGSVSRAPIGILRSIPQTRQALEQCMSEIAAAACGEGITLPPDVVDRTLRFIDAQPAAGKSSLQRDIAAGKPSELEAWLGGVVRRAARSGIQVPLCSHLYYLLLPLERRARGELKFAD
jgi:2-dehydropantoate 2-reductase